MRSDSFSLDATCNSSAFTGSSPAACYLAQRIEPLTDGIDVKPKGLCGPLYVMLGIEIDQQRTLQLVLVTWRPRGVIDF